MAVHGHTPHLDEHADQWHHHSADEGLPQHEHAGIASPITLIKSFILITVSVALVIGGLAMYFTSYTTKLKAKRFETNTLLASEGRDRKRTSETMLREPAPIGEKSYRIPIASAMDRVVEKYGAPAAASSAPAPK